MILYMLRDKLSGLWYKRGLSYAKTWVSQQEASVWTTRAGAISCKGTVYQRNRLEKQTHRFIWRDPEIVELCVYEKGMVTILEGKGWVALYANGRLVESHKTGLVVDASDMLRLLGVELTHTFSDRKTPPATI
jgi:hypothetical protein